MARVSLKRNINVGRVVSKLAITVIALYVGGTVVTELGDVMKFTCSPFYKGLTLIGWTIGDVGNAAGDNASCNGLTTGITETNGTGILAVVGIVAIAAIVMEFVDFKM